MRMRDWRSWSSAAMSWQPLRRPRSRQHPTRRLPTSRRRSRSCVPPSTRRARPPPAPSPKGQRIGRRSDSSELHPPLPSPARRGGEYTCALPSVLLRYGCARHVYWQASIGAPRVSASTRVTPVPVAPQLDSLRPRWRGFLAWLVGHPATEAELHRNSFDLLRLALALLVIVSHAYPLSGQNASESL